MKYLALALTLFCGSAHATNVFYWPVADQETGVYNVLYLTDQPDKRCPKTMLSANLENRDGEKLNALCWSRLRGQMTMQFSIMNLQTGQIFVTGLLGPVPGPALEAVLQKWRDEDQAAIAEFNRPGRSALNIHP